MEHGQRRAWIISSGTELTLGQTVDSNAAWLAAELAAAGVRCQRHVTVPDELEPLRGVLIEAARSADVVILTGGLGPTDDDLARAALAAASNDELVEDVDSLRAIRAYFSARGRSMPEPNRVQALRPSRGVALENRCGTAPGIYIQIDGVPCFALPGVPFEMKAMFDADVRPRVASAAGVVRSRCLNCFGLGESEIGAALKDLMARGRNPEVGTTVSRGVIRVRIYATAESGDAADVMLDRVEAEVRARLGPVVFGRDDQTLAGALGDQLVAEGWTVSTAESCTGGLVATLLTDVPGSSRYFLGGIVAYQDEMKRRSLGVDRDTLARHGAVSAATAEAMARGVLRAFESTCAIAVTGVAGPSGGSLAKPVGLVYCSVVTPAGVMTRELRLGSQSPREVIRWRAANTALNLLRGELIGAGR
jgi:nicotinamide-nucleotide amidase